jgi:hypothetical protein
VPLEQLALFEAPATADDVPGRPLAETFPFRRRRAPAPDGTHELRLLTLTCERCGAAHHPHRLGRRPKFCEKCRKKRGVVSAPTLSAGTSGPLLPEIPATSGALPEHFQAASGALPESEQKRRKPNSRDVTPGGGHPRGRRTA